MTPKKMLSFVVIFSVMFGLVGALNAGKIASEDAHSTFIDNHVRYEWDGSYLTKSANPAGHDESPVIRTEKEINLPDGEADEAIDFKMRLNRKAPVVFELSGMSGKLSVSDKTLAYDDIQIDSAIASASEKIKTIDESWQGGFESRMLKLSNEKAVSFSDMLVKNEDDRLDDEIAWCLSHMTPEDLAYEGLTADAIYNNALAIYSQAEKLDYVSVVELEDGHSTLEYVYGSDEASKTTKQIPYEIYYNGVVNMKLDWERVSLVNPVDGEYAEAPDGIFWRQYFLDPAEPPQSYTNHPVFIGPNNLHGENFPADVMESDAVFTGLEVGPLNLVVRSSDNKPVMIEFYPKNYAQTILATLLPVEKMAENGNGELLENMIPYLNDGRKIYGQLKILVLKQRDPFGKATIENTLTAMEVSYEVISLDDLDTLAEDDGFIAMKKIIVPSDQPLSFYQGLAAKRTVVEELISKGLCLQFHGAVEDQADSWDGIVMPGGFTRLTDTQKSDTTYLEGGYPKLTKLMENTEFVWDKQKYEGLSGTRQFDPDTFALDKIGFWASDVLIQNVSERAAHVGGSPERANQPVRLSNNHYGNCGEDQDVLGSAARTMLVPSFNVHNTTEDHVWNVLYMDDRWVPYQIDWSDEATRIDNAGISYDKQQGGGKDCACIIRSDGDGKVESVIDLFSDYITIKVRVTDINDVPIDGAKVYVFSEAWQSETNFSLGVWGVTDDNGEYETKVGENANYYLRVVTSIGSKPALNGQISKAVDMADAVAGKEFSFDIQIDGSLVRQWEETGLDEVNEGDSSFMLHMSSKLEWAAINGKNGYTDDTTYYETETSSPVWAVMTFAQMNDYLNNGTLKAAKIFREENLVELPKTLSDWYLMLIEDSGSKEVVYSGSVEAWIDYSLVEDGDEDLEQDDESSTQTDGDADAESDSGSTEDESDGCHQMGGNENLMLFVLLFALLVFVRRKPLSVLK